jgi:hypothetical protein
MWDVENGGNKELPSQNNTSERPSGWVDVQKQREYNESIKYQEILNTLKENNWNTEICKGNIIKLLPNSVLDKENYAEKIIFRYKKAKWDYTIDDLKELIDEGVNTRQELMIEKGKSKELKDNFNNLKKSIIWLKGENNSVYWEFLTKIKDLDWRQSNLNIDKLDEEIEKILDELNKSWILESVLQDLNPTQYETFKSTILSLDNWNRNFKPRFDAFEAQQKLKLNSDNLNNISSEWNIIKQKESWFTKKVNWDDISLSIDWNSYELKSWKVDTKKLDERLDLVSNVLKLLEETIQACEIDWGNESKYIDIFKKENLQSLQWSFTPLSSIPSP